jgi:DNA polymerase III epsilon subunit-like protein
MKNKVNIKKQLIENPVLCIDTETGGFNPKEDALCSVAVVLPDGSRAKEWFIYPYNKNYNNKALSVNKLSIDILKDKGISIIEFKREFIRYVENTFDESSYGKIQLLGHNVSFDIGFLKEVLGTNFNFLFHYHFKDSMILANMVKDLGLIPINQSISLKNLYIYLIGEDELSNNAHSSLADAAMSLEIYSKILSLLKQ